MAGGWPMELRTERLVLRDYREDDWEEIHLYASRPELTVHEPWGPNEIEDTKKHVTETIEKARQSPRLSHELAIVLRESGMVIGGAGIRLDPDRPGIATLGYIVNPDFQNRGIAAEAARALLVFGFDKLGLDKAVATCDIDNRASQRVMEKIGMEFVEHREKDVVIRGRARDSYEYAVTREAFFNKRGGAAS